MHVSGLTTVDCAIPDPEPATSEERTVHGLVYLWNKHEPHRVGEIALLDPEIDSVWLYGREAGGESPAARPRMRFGAQTPGRFAPGGPVVGEHVSREQLELRVAGDHLEVTLVGRAPALLDGVPLERGKRATLRTGTVLHVRQHATMVVVRRCAVVEPLDEDAGLTAHPFGEADHDGLVGESEATWNLRRDLARAVRAGGSVLLLGPSGSGKERAAGALHRLARRRGPLVAVNAAAVPPGVLEAELFGNIRNYPNAGTPERKGYVGEAEGGTLFIDEIARLSADGQAALLRLLQEHRYHRLGEAASRKADVLVVAATNEDPALLRFDFRMRFEHVVELPPLSRRAEDVVLIARDFVLALAREKPALAQKFVVDVGGRREVDWTPAMVHAMACAPWQGNVRQLQSFLLGAMARRRERPLHPPADVRPWGMTPSPAPAFSEEAPGERADAALSEAARLQDALEKCRWNVTQAAAMLGLPNRRAMYRLMERSGVSRR